MKEVLKQSKEVVVSFWKVLRPILLSILDILSIIAGAVVLYRMIGNYDTVTSQIASIQYCLVVLLLIVISQDGKK